MIKANKGTVHMEGAAHLLEAELMTIVKGLYTSLAKGYGEEFAKDRIEYVFKFAIQPDEEKSSASVKKSLIHGILKDIISAIEEETEGEK